MDDMLSQAHRGGARHDAGISWQAGWRALAPFAKRLSGAGLWLTGGVALSVLALVGGLGLLGLSGGFLTGAAMAGLSASTAAAFNFFMPGAGVRFFAVLRTTTRWGERVLSHEGTFRLLAGLRLWLYLRLSHLSPRQLQRYHGASLLNSLVRDIDALDNLYPRVLMPMASACLVLALLIGLYAWAAPALIWLPALLSALTLLVLPMLGWRMGRVLLPHWMRLRGELRIRLLDACEGLEDLSLQRQAWAAQRQRTLATQSQWLAVHLRSGRRAAALRGAVALSVGVLAWACLGLLGAEPIEERLPGPWIAALVLLLMGCAELMQPLASACLDLPGTATAARRLQAIADEAPATVYAAHGPTPQDGRIDIEDLHFAWDAHTPVFEGLSLHIASGEHVLLTGESGCGKSSLIQLLTRLEEPRRGRLRLGGVAMQTLDEATLRSHVACATQFTWAQTATLADNLRLARPDATEAEMLDVLALVGLSPSAAGWRDGLNTWVEEGGANLSGGQRRRLGVARALLRQAPITLLDEPSEGLDLTAEAELIERITGHLVGRTLVWASHRPAAPRAFDRTVCLDAR